MTDFTKLESEEEQDLPQPATFQTEEETVQHASRETKVKSEITKHFLEQHFQDVLRESSECKMRHMMFRRNLQNQNMSKKEKKSLETQFAQQEADYKAEQATRYDVVKIREILNQRVGENLLSTVTLYNNLVETFLNDDEGGLRKLKLQANENFDKLTHERSIYYKMENSGYVPSKEDLDARYSYFRTFTNLRDVGRYLQALARVAKDHIANRHRTFQGELSQDLADLSQLLVEIVGNHNGQADVSALHANAQTLLARIETIQEKLLRNGPDKGFSARGCELFLSFLLFARELINHYEIIAMLQQKLNTSEPEKVVQNKN